ncbi:isoprenylcysteine carboxylmethyltransferase family protein [Phanerochaete sordida]|uniref:Protein-S-isoprenylcysteine O-methyltransferase n=1 Tax=Phanerochaete sordida TaxID=48140 RepID=A0A9P3G5S3_9APHY|nr:isoprenylcysteine carboxylmethyltransferase family protein [Phanerochaete sordida]
MIWFPTPLAATLSLSPLWKIPLLVPGAHLAALGMTPPNPPPTAAEKAKYEGSGKGDNLATFMRVSGKLWKIRIALFYIGALCESAALLSRFLPEHAREPVERLLVSSGAPGPAHIRFTPLWLGGVLLMGGAACLRLWAFRTLGRFFTFEMSVKQDHRLVTSGPYAVVRHPAYVSVLLLNVGVVTTSFAPGSWYAECVGWGSPASKAFGALWATWSLIVPVLLMTRVNKEDEVMRAQFGEEWEAWARRTPYKLVPYIY